MLQGKEDESGKRSGGSGKADDMYTIRLEEKMARAKRRGNAKAEALRGEAAVLS